MQTLFKEALCGTSCRVGILCLAFSGLTGCANDLGVDGFGANSLFDGGPPSVSSASTRAAYTANEKGYSATKTLFQDQPEDDGSDKLERFVEEGTGQLITEPRSLAGDALILGDEGDITLNVVNADLREVVAMVLSEGLNANYVIDPKVTGSITIRTNRPVPSDEIIPLLSSVLEANGAALIENQGNFRIVPADQAAVAGGKPSTRLSLKGGKRGAGILVAPLRYADAVTLADLLQPFVTNQGSVQIDGDRNTLLITGSTDQIQTISDLIDMFDVDWMAGMSFGFYPLERVSASDLALELDQIFGTGFEEDGVAAPLRFVPIDRLSALLVISNEPSKLRRAESWIQRLDKVGEGNEHQIYVYSVQNGRAGDLAPVLGELFDIRSTVVRPDPLLAPGLDPIDLRSSLLSDESETSSDEEDRRPSGGERSSGQRRPSTPFPSFPSSNGFNDQQDDIGTRIVADEANNSLLIRARPKEYRKIESALRELDKPPLQVLLEATIAEVTLRDELSYGVQWFFNAGQADFTLSERASGIVDPFFPGFSGLLSSSDVRIAIDALDAVSDVKVISSPQILVLDNQTARLEVGDEVPIVTRQSEGLNDDDRIVNTVEQRQTGVILSVTPRVNASGLVVLDIQQEVSDVVQTTTSGIDSPTISQRKVGTTVVVGNDQTVALGGLIQDDTNGVRVGIPILSSLPLIGPLFGSTTDISERTELLVLITPQIFEDSDAAVAATEELRRRLRSVAPLEARIGRSTSPARKRRQPVNTPLRSDRDFVLLLASLPTRAQAEAAWQTYQTEYGDLLAGLPHRIKEYAREDGLNGYSLSVGPAPSFTDAERLCDRLRIEGGDCLVMERKV